MSVPKLDGNTELIIVQHMLRDLEDYLKSDELYWHVAEPNPLGSHMPQLTIGALLEALIRAAAAQDELTPGKCQELAAARAQHDRIRAAHPALYIAKAIHELHSRLGSWQANLEDEDRKTTAFYAQDARVRANTCMLGARRVGRDDVGECAAAVDGNAPAARRLWPDRGVTVARRVRDENCCAIPAGEQRYDARRASKGYP